MPIELFKACLGKIESRIMLNPQSGFRNDIQGMRAIAVLLVLIFHIFPQFMPGGFIGVDVFFAISGYLICGLILNRSERDRKFSIVDFYARRMRRLLPAASCVLVFTAITSLFLLPETRWFDTAKEIIASTFYFENFHLHNKAIDYLSADKPPSPVQHFWSLSVEEQFYILWPILMVLIVAIAAKAKMSIRAIATVSLALIFVLSLYFSISITKSNPPAAYFVTHTRLWEIALGGILAGLSPFIKLQGAVRTTLTGLGLLMIIFAGVTYSEATPFPGAAALIPTLGAGLLLLAGSNSNSPTMIQKALGIKPMKFFGDISYSLYLWHWPLIIFATAKLGENMSFSARALILVLSILIAWASKVWIEDPVRFSKKFASNKNVIGLGLGLMALSFGSGLALKALAEPITASSPVIYETDADYPGAAVLSSGDSFTANPDKPFLPLIKHARGDNPTVYADKCHVSRPDTAPIPCIYSPQMTETGKQKMVKTDSVPETHSSRVIMLVGDSHAAHWLPALKTIAAQEGWVIISHTKSSCAFIDRQLIIAKKPYPECKAWGEAVLNDIISRKPDAVVTSMVTNHFAKGSTSALGNRENLAIGLASFWDKLGEKNIPVVAINGTPRFKPQIPECVSENLPNWQACNLDRATAIRKSGMMKVASEKSSNATFADMTDAFCTEDTCEVIVGNILVYRDQHHITSTYARTIAPYLAPYIKKAMNK